MRLDWIEEAESLWAPPPVLLVSEWSDTERMLSSEASPEPGRWYTSRTPYLKEIQDAFNDPLIELIVLMIASQLGKTEVLLNWIGYIISQDPSPILLMYPTLEIAESVSKDRVAAMIRDTPCLSGKVKDVRSRNSGNTLLHKQFPGGHLTLVGANSPTSLASRPVRVVLCDEVDRYTASAGTEGNPIKLAFQRTANFWNSKHAIVSTPTIKGLSRIEEEYLKSDMRRYWVPCPKCGEQQVLKWDGVDYKTYGVENTFYRCEHCKQEIEETRKISMLAQGVWRAEKPTGHVAGFHLSALYSPFTTWQKLAQEWQDCQSTPEDLKVFINTKLAETFKEFQNEELSADTLYGRRKEYPAEVPEGALMLTAGVDGQADRLELTVFGWGFRGEVWIIEHVIMEGDPALAEVWKMLDLYLARTYTHESGLQMGISYTLVDTGGKKGYTPMAYSFIKGKQARKIFGVKGSNQRNAPVAFEKPSRNNRLRVPVWIVGTDTAKDWIYPRLRKAKEGEEVIHLPMSLDREFCEQLTAEQIEFKKIHGQKVREYINPKGKRNEALDMFVYGYAAFCIFNPKLELFAEKIAEHKAKTDPIGPPLPPDYKLPEDATAEQAPETPPTKPFVPKRKGWLKRGRRW